MGNGGYRAGAMQGAWSAVNTAGHVMEIFSAIQGEGPWVGIRQIFLRLYRCNLHCVWCDTPESFELTGPCQVEDPPGNRTFTQFENPITVQHSLQLLEPFLKLPHHSISLTGGEPLLQKDFLIELLPMLKKKSEKIFLETGGSLPELLEPLLPYLDFISMDIKLPSSAHERQLWDKHEAFLKLAASKETYVKIVVTDDTLESDIEKALTLVHEIAPDVQAILQPVTAFNGSKPPTETQLLTWHNQALKILDTVRVIPQVHKLIAQK